MLSLSGILEKIVLGLFYPHSFQIRENKVLREQVVNGDTEILRGGHLVGEALITIQVGVIKAVDHAFSYARIQLGKIADHPGEWIHLPTYGHFDDVVVSVTIRISAFPVNRVILLRAVRVCIEAVGSAQSVSAR
jgi:hypothetical protein